MHIESTPRRRSRSARVVFRCCLVVLLLVLSAPVIYVYLNDHHRPRHAKAAADAFAIAAAIRAYARHCGGLPAGEAGHCPVVAESGGPFLLPRALILEQTNREGRRAGPFISILPAPPTGWSGAGGSYAYYIFGGGQFLVCSRGDGMAMNSNRGTTCP